ncbi:MAG: hypothetical protein WA459_11690 [Stellaceae bacterium]
MPMPTRQELQTLRDELQVRVHLASKEVQDAWDSLETRWKHFQAQAQLDKTSSNVGTATQLLAAELKDGYDRIKKAL